MIDVPTAALLARCPGCGEDRLVEWDAGLLHWFCLVCGRTWRVT